MSSLLPELRPPSEHLPHRRRRRPIGTASSPRMTRRPHAFLRACFRDSPAVSSLNLAASGITHGPHIIGRDRQLFELCHPQQRFVARCQHRLPDVGCQVDVLAPEKSDAGSAHTLTADGKVIAAGTLEDIAYAVLQTSETTFLDVATYALLDWAGEDAEKIAQEKAAGSQWVYVADGKTVYIADEAMLKTLIRQKMAENGIRQCVIE